MYGNSRSGKAPTQSELMWISWDLFVQKIWEANFEHVQEGLKLLDNMRTEFDRYADFSSMPFVVRQAIAGIPNTYEPHTQWFGTMKAAVKFGTAVKDNRLQLSDALNHIPLRGPVHEQEYRWFALDFKKAFVHGEGGGVAIATRLLAIKRPDCFVCLSSKNKFRLCRSFRIPPGRIDLSTYWDEIIERIRASPWWNTNRPVKEQEAQIWNARVALLDVLVYEDEEGLMI